MQELQSLLHSISTGTNLNVDASQMQKASAAAQELSIHLNNAYNATTGNFDLSRLDKSLKTSGQNVQQLSNQLLSAGQVGQQAFVKLAQSIASADRPMIGLNAKMKEFATTLANTARWQLSSSLLHGFMGAISTAYNYAQDLNESLNNIRIVTGYSSDQMADFAVQANKAAKALSTTTTAYTDAALIYYQQGDSTSEVMEKAEVTVKMANVVGQSASQVSDQLTAIWNNFDDGSQSLEYYADVITALGAATASSSEEIATGLEKFSSVAETVGLSYEYATAALATVTAQTRQSADVVGTAFKTLFARLNDLKLGETLEDGTTLGTYTENLAKVGVDIKDASGQLKDMDIILEETAAKWQQLDKDQQVALAKGVAGIRQYNTFIALMDNWDFMQENLDVVAESGGVLQEQADIYAESWEAASNRVRASAEKIYDQLLDDEFFIDINNGFSSLLDSVSAFIDGIGGVKGVIVAISSVFLSHIAGKITPALNNLKHSFAVIFQSAQQQAAGLTAQMDKVVGATLAQDKAAKAADPSAGMSTATIAELEGTLAINKAKANLSVVSKDLTATERQRYELQLQMIQAQQDEAEAAARVVDEAKKKLEVAQQSWDIEATMSTGGKDREAEEKALMKDAAEKRTTYLSSSSGENLGNLNEATERLAAHRAATEEASLALEKYSSAMQEAYVREMEATNGVIENSTAVVDASGILGGYTEKLTTMSSSLESGGLGFKEAKNGLADLQSQLEMATGKSLPGLKEAFEKCMRSGNTKQLQKAMDELAAKLRTAKIPAKDLEETLRKLGQGKAVTSIKKGYKDLGKAAGDYKKKQDAVNKGVAQFNPKHMVSGIEAITKTAAGMGQLAMAVTSVRSVFQAWSNDDLSFGEKLTTSIMSLSMAIPMLTGGMSALKAAYAGTIGVQKAFSAALATETTQTYLNQAAKLLLNTTNKEGVATKIAEHMVKKGLITEDQKNLVISNLLTASQKAENAEEMKGLMTDGLVQASKGKTIAQKWAELGVTMMNTKETSKNRVVKLLGAAADGLASVFGVTLAASKTTETGAVIANTAAWYANPIMWIALVIVGVIAALAALIAIICSVSSALSDAYNADAIAAENAEKAAENLNKAYEDAKSAYEDMIGAMDNYKSARESLSELTKGTVEYQEALQEANAAALELLQNYPEYFGEGDYTWKDGELIISDAAMENAQKAELEKVQSAQAAATMASAGAKQARAVANSTQMKRDQRDAMGIGDGDLVWKGIGASIASTVVATALPGLGGLIGGGLINHAFGNDLEKAAGYDDAVDKSMELFAEDENLFSNQGYLADKMAEVGVTNVELIQALWDNRDSLIEMGQEFNAAALQMKVAAENVANNLVQNNEVVQESGEAEAVAAVSAKAYENAYKEEQEKALADIKDRGLFNTGTDTSKALMAEYAKISGLDQDSNYEVTNYVGDGSVKVKKTLDDGSVEEVTLTAEEIAATVAADRANKQINESMETVMADMLALGGKDATDEQKGLKDFLVDGNLEGATKSEVEAIQSQLLVEGDGTIFGDLAAVQQTAQNLQNTLTGDPEDYGYDTWMEMAEALAESAEKAEEAWANIELPEGLEGTDDISLKAAQAIQKDKEWLEAGSMGEEGVKTYTEGINKLTETMGEAEKAEFMEKIGDIDWSNWYAMDDVSAMLEEMGVDLNMTTEELEAFTEAMRVAGGASPAEMLQKTDERIAALGSTLAEGIPPGSVLDKETYDQLIEANGDLADSFITNMDGTMQYIGSEELGLEQLELGEALNTKKEMSALYENSKEAAGDIDFKKLSTMDYTFADEMAAQDEMIAKAEDQYDAAAEAAEGFHPIQYQTLENNKANAKAALEAAEANKAQLEEANLKAREGLQTGIGDVMANEDLMAVAEYNGWDEAKLKEIQEGVAAGNEDAIKQAQEFNRQMNMFYEQGDAGTYDFGELEEKIASTAGSIEELDALTKEYALSEETYAKAITGLFYSAAAEAESITELNDLKKKVEDAGGEVNLDYYNEQVQRLAKSGADSAESLTELQDVMRQAAATGAEIDYSIYADNLIRLAEGYSNCAEEIASFEQALASGNEEAIAKAQEQLEISTMLGEAADKYGFSAEEMEVQAKQMAKAYGISEKAAAKLAVENQRMNKGVSSLAENWGDWKKELSKSDKTTTDYAKAAAALTSTIADLVGASEDLELSPEFLEAPETLEMIEKAAEGDIDAINALGVAVAAESVKLMQLDADMTRTLADGTTKTITMDQFNTAKNTVLAGLQELQTQVANGSLAVGDSVGAMGADWAASLNEMALATGMSVEEMNEMLSSMGVDANVTVTEVKQKTKVPKYTTITTKPEDQGDGTTKSESYTYTSGYEEVEGTVQVAQIDMGEDGKSPNVKFVGNGSVAPSSTSGGGGGGGDKKKADTAKKSDTVERYKEVTDALDDNADAMDKASRAADRLYGKDRLAKMQEANRLLQKEIDLTKKKREEAEKYLDIDRDALDAAAEDAGISFTYDKKGNISNYEDAMTTLFNELDTAINKANADGNADEDEQAEIDAIQAKIDAVKDAMSTYEETRELIEDLDTELEEKFHEWQDANFDILNTELELKIEINDMDLQRLEYYLGKMEDDFYQMAEAAALMVLNKAGDGFGGQLTSYMDQLEHQEEYLEKLHKQYAAGEISQANYIEGLKNASSAIYEQLGNLQELDATMMEYYSETLATAGEEIAKYTELMENASGVLDHYASIAEMLGKSTDYKYMGKILSAQASVAANAYKTSKANYEMLKAQEDERKQAYDDAVARGASNSELEMLEKQWWDARSAANEAQDTMLSDVETWAEALRAILDNSIADFGQELENTLAAGYGSFDAMSSAFERKNALQEEYLTTTNKIYETNKMMRTAQQEIDKTTNEAAKRRLKQFISETGALQDQTKLSQYELDIQQAKYDLLLAEIALQEAQNAKSTVRLQRDNEGNMSYVYTADANKVAEAQQKVEDAQNALYNKGLEGANDYVQKYQETMQEMYDTITEIQQNYLDGAYENEAEYNAAIEEAKEYYYDKLTQYSNLYQVALTTDTRVAADAWTTEFASMTENTEDWMTAVNGYVGDVQGAFATWKSQMDTIEKETLGNMDETLSNIVSDSEDLAETVTDEVIPALEKEMEAVKDVTDKYATFRETLESITTEYEAMAKAAEDAVKAANGLENGTDTGGPGDGNGDNNNNGNNNSGDENNNNNNNNGNNNSTTLTWERVKAVYNAINGGKWGHGSDRKKNGKAAGYTDEEIAKGQELINKVYGGMSLAAAKKALGFASGGYTGDWSGSYGKLAFLHQKELILNKGDTENFLASMGILERILQMIDLQATSAQLGGLLATPKFNHNNNEVLEQNVHIEASFPGVSDHNEIELAMTNLINTASQYANRK